MGNISSDGKVGDVIFNNHKSLQLVDRNVRYGQNLNIVDESTVLSCLIIKRTGNRFRDFVQLAAP